MRIKHHPLQVMVLLPSGRRHLVPRDATNLERPERAVSPAVPLPVISVRTILPLARLVQQLKQAKEEQAENKQWELRLERARYQAKRAERQYQAVEPENRLVARSLEKQWEEQLRAVESAEKEYYAWKSSRFGSLTQADREAIVALGSDLPALWRAPTTGNTERKQMVRLVIREVIVVLARGVESVKAMERLPKNHVASVRCSGHST